MDEASGGGGVGASAAAASMGTGRWAFGWRALLPIYYEHEIPTWEEEETGGGDKDVS